MRVVIVGVDTAVGRAVAERLRAAGRDVLGVAPVRPLGWPAGTGFLPARRDEAALLGLAVAGAGAVVISGAAQAETMLAAAATAGVTRTVVITSATDSVADRDRVTRGAPSGWIHVRCGLLLGRDTDDDVVRMFTGAVVFDRDPVRRLAVTHPHDAADAAVRALGHDGVAVGCEFEVVAGGRPTVREIAAAVGRPAVRIPKALLPRELRIPDPVRTPAGQSVEPVWPASACVADFALSARGRTRIAGRVRELPWRLARVRDVHDPHNPAEDGVEPVPAGTTGVGEFDTPIDPRFPAFVATNLSEALPGPFSPSSASVAVRGTRAAGQVIAQRLRPGGAVQREMAVRTTGVFGHRLYAGITSATFMARTVPFVDSAMIVDAFFGQTAENIDVFGAQPPPPVSGGALEPLRQLAGFAVNFVGLSVGGRADTRAFTADVAAAEHCAERARDLDDRQVRELISLVRDHVVHGWVLSSASIMLCAAYGVVLRLLCGRDTVPAAGLDVASAQSLGAVHRLADAVRRDDAVREVLARPGRHLEHLHAAAPAFHRLLADEIRAIGHRGPGEVEMRSLTFADDPELLLRMVARAVAGPGGAARPPSCGAPVPWWARPVAAAAAGRLREREVRRDRMVRAVWVLRGLLREYGARLATAGVIGIADDVFFLTVDELGGPPPHAMSLVHTRRAEQRRLTHISPPEAFSGRWSPVADPAAALGPGQSLQGLGVGGGRVRGRVRVVAHETLDDLEPGEVLVAKVTDVGYTPAFAYAAAVVTELGGPLSHAAIVAREYGVPCVVNVRGAAAALPGGALIEVDGASGAVRVLES